MFSNIAHAIKIALDLKISKKIIVKTLPKLSFPGRFNYLKKGKIKKMLHKNELIMIDGAHTRMMRLIYIIILKLLNYLNMVFGQ